MLFGCYTPITLSESSSIKLPIAWNEVLTNQYLSHELNSSEQKGWTKEVHWPGMDLLTQDLVLLNHQIKQQILQITAKKIEKHIAYAGVLPSLDVSASSTDSIVTSQALQLSLTGILFDWGASISAAQSIDSDAAKLEFNLLESINQIALQVSLISIDWYTSDLALQLHELKLTNNEKLFQFSTDRYQAGIAQADEYLTQKNQLEATKDNLVSYQIGKQNLTSNLKQLVGAYNPVEFDRQYPIRSTGIGFAEDLLTMKIPELEWQWTLEEIVSNHPKIQSSAIQVDQSNYAAAAQLKSIFPVFNFSASQSATSFSADQYTNSLTLAAVGNLFSWGGRIKQYEASKVNVEITIEQYAQTIVETFTEIENRSSLDSKYHLQFEHVQDQALIAKERKDLETLRYAKGLSTYSEYIRSINDYFSFQQALISAFADWQKNRLSLYVALGIKPFSVQNTQSHPSI